MIFIDNKYTRWYYSIINAAKARQINTEYIEKHHIIPECFFAIRKRKGPTGWIEGDPDHSSNISLVTAREHFICHWLLTKMTTGKSKALMLYALNGMRRSSKKQIRYETKITSRVYSNIKGKLIVSEETKRKLSDKAKGRVSPNKGKSMSDEQKLKLSLSKKGTHQSSETIAKQAASRTGQQRSEETKRKMSANHGYSMLGKHHTADTKEKMSIANKGRANANKGKPAFNRGIAHSPDTILKFKEAHQNRERLQCPHCNKLIAKCSFTRWHGGNCKNK